MAIRRSALRVSFACITSAWIIRRPTHVSESSTRRQEWTQLRVPCAMWSRSSAPGHGRSSKWQESSSIMQLAWNLPSQQASYHYRRRFVNMLSVLSHRSCDLWQSVGERYCDNQYLLLFSRCFHWCSSHCRGPHQVKHSQSIWADLAESDLGSNLQPGYKCIWWRWTIII